MENDSVDWKWKRLPYFALIRAFGRAGYQVATVARDGDLDHKVILLFSSPEAAQQYAASRPQGFDDWKSGPLPTWERLAFFLKSMEATAGHVCLDFDREAQGAEIALPVEMLLDEIESLKAGD